MKASTLISRIAKSNNKDGSQPRNPHYEAAIRALDGGRVQIGFSGFRNGHGSVNYLDPMYYLAAWRISYEIGNDAPRGGINGDYIRLSDKGLRQTKDYRAFKAALKEAAEKESKEASEQRKAALHLKYQEIKTAGLFMLWNNVDAKLASGLSWSAYRNDLKLRFPQEWLELKDLFKKQV